MGANQTSPSPLGRRLKEQRRARGWSQEHFAEVSGLSSGYISQLETGMRRKNPGRDIVLKIAKAFSEPEDIWLDLTKFARDHDVIDYRPHFRDVVDADPFLLPEQKQALITTYNGFVAARRRARRDGRASQPAE